MTAPFRLIQPRNLRRERWFVSCKIQNVDAPLEIDLSGAEQRLYMRHHRAAQDGEVVATFQR